MKEEWRKVVGEKYFEVSSLGRVRTLSRTYTKPGRYGAIGTYHIEGRIRKAILSERGYLKIRFRGTDNPLSIHRLVAIAFIPNPANKPFVHHVDHNKQNNCVDNLQWCTHKENMRYKAKAMMAPHGENHPHTFLTREQVLEINQRSQTEYYRDLAEEFGVSFSTISKIKNKQTWRHLWQTNSGT